MSSRDISSTLAPPLPEQEQAEIEAQAEERAKAQTHARKGLESTALRATFWTVADYGFSMALRVVNTVVLTHLLMPESFGLMTLVTTLVVGISLISDIGLSPSVIQSPRGDDPVLLNTAWTIQVLRGLAIFTVALLMAWPMSLFYHEPRLLFLLPALGVNIVIGSFSSTNLLSMQRHMGVRRIFILDITTQLVSLLITASFAWFYPSVWALVTGVLVSGAYRMTMSFYRPMIPGIPNRFCWDKECVHSLVHFGKWILLATAFFFFASQADRLILGRLISLSLLGVYGIAYSISDIPRAVINSFALKVGYPFIAKMIHLPIQEFRAAFLRYRFKALMAGALMLCLMVHLGGGLIRLVYDHRYQQASWMAPILALGLWHTMLYSTTMPALFSLGKSRYGAIGNGCYCFAVIAAIPTGFHFFGMPGAVAAVACGDLPLYLVSIWGASREGVSSWRQDVKATGVFVLLLAVGVAIRMAIFGFSHGVTSIFQ